MKVFVVGATGVLGRRVVPLLVEAGHEVAALARSEGKARELRAAGATPVTFDLFDAEAVRDAVVEARPGAVVNLATHIPRMSQAARPSAWVENDRIRSDGARNLVAAARAAGAVRYVQESITFTYADGGDTWLSEDAPVDPGPALASALEAEATAASFSEGTGEARTAVVLRFAMFYGPDSHLTVDMLKAASLGVAPVVGPADAHHPNLHLDDAAAAVVAALSLPGGTYNVVDDEPLTRVEMAAAFASAARTRKARRLPALIAKAGGDRASYLARSQRVSNAKLKATGLWAPAHPTLRTGLVQVAAEVSGDTWHARQWRGRRLALAVLAASAVQIGLWAAVAPAGWFRTFPGLGMSWTAVDGPFNEHLSRDVGNLFLALAVVTIAVVARPDRFWVRAVSLAWLVMSVPHIAYHALHADLLPAWSSAVSLAALAVTVVVPLRLAFSPGPSGTPRAAGAGHRRVSPVAPAAGPTTPH